MNKVIGGTIMLALGWWVLGKAGDPMLAGIKTVNLGLILIFGGFVALIWGAFSSGNNEADPENRAGS